MYTLLMFESEKAAKIQTRHLQNLLCSAYGYEGIKLKKKMMHRACAGTDIWAYTGGITTTILDTMRLAYSIKELYIQLW